MTFFKYVTIEKQKGAALIVLVLAFIMATSVLLITNYSIDRGKTAYENKTSAALAKAKESLISYATTYQRKLTGTGEPLAGMLGFLPCPDGGTFEGESETGDCGTQYQSYLGRLPWKSLGIEPLKDASGNCLWYAVSSEYKNIGRVDPNMLSMSSGLVRSEMLNEDSNGSFTVYDVSGNIIAGSQPENRAVAIIIAPGGPLPGQNRSHSGGQCGGDYNASEFLELYNGIDNRDITQTDDSIDDFITSSFSNVVNLNDRIMTVSQKEIFDEIKRNTNFMTYMENTTRELAECIAEFGLTNPAPPGGCDLDQCLQQCTDDQAICYNQCDDCSNQCDLDYDACIAAGTKPNICNKTRKNCNKACPKLKQCQKDCDAVFGACEINCNTSCTPGAGSGGNDYRLPWPAALQLADYRDSRQYTENTGAAYLGRYPADVGNPSNPDNALAVTGNPGNRYLLESDYTSVNPSFTHCKNLNTDALGVAPDTFNSVERRIWQNWKDHFFYAVAQDYVSSPANTPTPAIGACTNCLTVNGAGAYSAIVLFSGERLSGQVRTVLPNDTDTKRSITNYLEGDNTIDNGNILHGAVTSGFNDIAYCIDESMQVAKCPP